MTSINYRGYEIENNGGAWTGRKGDNYAQAGTLDELQELIDDGEAVLGAWRLARPEPCVIVERAGTPGSPPGTAAQASDAAVRAFTEAWRNRPNADENLYDAPEYDKYAPRTRVAINVGGAVACWAVGVLALYGLVCAINWVLG